MAAFILKRALFAVPTLMGLALVTFLMLRAIPGDPALGLVGDRAEPEAVEAIRRELGQDKGVASQFAGYLKLLASGNLGRSYYTKRDVTSDILSKFPNTLKLALSAMLVATFAGILLGVLSAVARGTYWEKVFSALSLAGISLPVFWVGLILMLLFAFVLPWLPPSGMGDGQWAYLVLPAATLGLNSAAYIARITRMSLVEVLGSQFIMTARAKGLSPFRVVAKHALRNALVPVITLIAIDFGSYLNGSVLTETIFGWDGLGRYALDGIMKRDYPVILGTVLAGSAVFVFFNLVADVAYAFIDPRIRYGRR
ncbi:MAG: ABC transporter permease [Nitrospirae bacterium]|nr:ABC transporter permease [Nitrospirota bacterium]